MFNCCPAGQSAWSKLNAVYTTLWEAAMTGGKSRWLGFALVAAGASAGLFLLTSMMNSAFAYGDTAAITGDYAGVPVEVMGASGLPNPLTQPGSGSDSRSGQLRSNGSKSVLHAGFRPPPENRWWRTSAPSSPRNTSLEPARSLPG